MFRRRMAAKTDKCHYWEMNFTFSDLWSVGNKFSTVPNKSYRLHAGVREGSITCKFWQALNCILERVDDRIKVLLKYRSWNINTIL